MTVNIPVKAYIDGSGNSDRIQACATVIYIGDTCHEKSQILPAGTTNNVGEYSGLLLCMQFAETLGVESLLIHSDSKIVVNQVNGLWRCNDINLQSLRNAAWELGVRFSSISLVWIPRSENKQADKLCRKAIKQYEMASL